MPISIVNYIYSPNGGGSLVPQATRSYVDAQIGHAASIDTRASGTRWNRATQSILKDIRKGVDEWRFNRRFLNDNSNTEYTAEGLPYRRNGDILVVLTTSTDLAGFDSDYNRVLIHPEFAKLLSEEKVYYKDSGGNPHLLTLSDVVLHEVGHRAEGSSRLIANRQYGPKWGDGKYNTPAEKIEAISQLLARQTDPSVSPRADHSQPYFKDENGDLQRLSKMNLNVMKLKFPGIFSNIPENKILKGLDGSFYVVDTQTGKTSRISDAGGQFGRLAGSALGNYLARDDGALTQIAASTVLGSIGQAFGDALSINVGAKDLSRSFDAAFASFDQTLYNNLKSASVGAISSFTTMELGRSLGVEGFGAELFNVAAGTTIGPIYDKVISNILGGNTPFQNFNIDSIFGSANAFGNAMGASFASFFGSKLGSLVVSPTTSASAALASLGSAAGAYALSAAGSTAIGGWAAAIFKGLGHFGNILGPGIGSFVGFVLGALLGNLFGRKKPRIPSASAEVVLNLDTTRYQLGSISVAENGNRPLVVQMATAAELTLNGIIDQVVNGSRLDNANSSSPTQIYGHYGNQIRARMADGNWQNFSSADSAVDWGITQALHLTKIKGGNIIQKRALGSNASNSVVSMHVFRRAAGVQNGVASRMWPSRSKAMPRLPSPPACSERQISSEMS